MAAQDRKCDGKGEARATSNPAGMIEREASRADDAVDMGVKLEFLVHVCNTLKKPISAPRCLGLRDTFSRVSALARSSKPMEKALFKSDH